LTSKGLSSPVLGRTTELRGADEGPVIAIFVVVSASNLKAQDSIVAVNKS
jgi:hypothetical protein